MASSFSSLGNWVYDVFPSFSGEDVRVTFLSHFLKELDKKLIITFKDSEIERSQSLNPELKKAIRTSRIAVVVFSDKYTSSSWCLDELLEIVKCKEESGQMVIPIFYGLDPSHVRKQTGRFGEAFEKTCQRKTEEETKLWRQSLTDVANLLGYHSQIWHNEAKMIEAIANDVLGKLNLTPPKDFEDFVGMEAHIANMSVLLHLESEEVRMVGIWGSSGIGKTTIARVLYSQLSRRFQGSIFIDRAFVSKSKEVYNIANPDDYNMKLHLLSSFLSRILDKKDIRVDRLDAIEERLKNQKVLIFIDDLDDQMVLDTLAGQTQWFGRGSRVIVVTKDKHFLRAHGIDHIYDVHLPSNELALEMFCRSAFRKNFPPNGFMELASEIALRAGNLPLGLKVLGSYLRGRDKEDWVDMLPSLRNRLNGKIKRTLKVSYDGLDNEKDKAVFRHIACLFNGAKIKDIKLLLADSELDVSIGLKNLVDKSLIHVIYDIVEMHYLLQDMGKEIVRTQCNELGEREFLVNSKDVFDLLEDNIGTKKVLGISLDMDEIDELNIHENAFKGMCNLLFLKIYTKKWDEKKEVRWHLPECFNYLPHKLRFLRMDGYPMRYMPSNFRPENLVKLEMQESKLEKLWEGVQLLRGLRNIDLKRSRSLKEIPDLSMATNLETLDLSHCSSLVELTSSIQYLNKLDTLNMSFCENLETLPTGMNLQSLCLLYLKGCSRLKSFPNISTNISTLILIETSIVEFLSIVRLNRLNFLSMCRMKSEKLWKREQPLTSLLTALPHHTLEELYLSDIPSLVELPSSIQNFNKLKSLWIRDCINLETLPCEINLKSLECLCLSGCSQLKSFPNISTNISVLILSNTGIEEVPWWIENFSKLESLNMQNCNNLRRVSLNIFKLKLLSVVDFSHCGALTGASWDDSSSDEAMEIDNSGSELLFKLIGSNMDPEALLRQRSIIFKEMILSCEEVPSYFTHRTSGTSLTIPLPQTSPPQSFFTFRVCAVLILDYVPGCHPQNGNIQVNCRFKDRFGNNFDSYSKQYSTGMLFEKGSTSVLTIKDIRIPINKDNAPLAELNYDHVDIQLHLSNETQWYTSLTMLEKGPPPHMSYGSEDNLILKGWGIRLCEDFSSPESQLENPNTLPEVCEVDEENKAERGEERRDSFVEIEKSQKRIRIT